MVAGEKKITVLMPVYNGAAYLREAIDSILNQTFPYFEFLIIDDGSSDHTVEIVRSYDDQRIVLVRNEYNMGISATLNKGIELASCDIIARMDADDICNPQRLARQYFYLMNHRHCAMVSSWARVITHDKRFVRLEKYHSEYYYYNLTFECWMYHPTIMFRRDPVKQVGMYSMPFSEDYDLFWKLSVRFEIGNIEEPLVDYRLSPTSLNTVLKKQEYDIANEQNVLRNIRYYMGSNFTLSRNCLECLRHNFEPIGKSGNIDDAVASLEYLDLITERIMAVENPNRDVQSIREAHYYKRQFMIRELAKALPKFAALFFLSRLRAWSILATMSANFVKWQLKKVKSFILSGSL